MVRMAWITSGYIPSPRRMAVIAGTTFTQLVRMKVFLFLGLFAVALLALSSFRLSAVLGLRNNYIRAQRAHLPLPPQGGKGAI